MKLWLHGQQDYPPLPNSLQRSDHLDAGQELLNLARVTASQPYPGPSTGQADREGRPELAAAQHRDVQQMGRKREVALV